jgi:hypothetical protein
MNERRYLSIGEVLGLLLEEFPDVTISKIRFLESQGLIEPERTPSGYRKFYDEDVETLCLILREQRQNFLPLKVIKDRLDTGEIVRPDPTPTGSIRLPRSAVRGASPPPLAAPPRSTQTPQVRSTVPSVNRNPPPVRDAGSTGVDDTAPLRAAARSHPAAAHAPVPSPLQGVEVEARSPEAATRPDTGLTAEELCAYPGIDEDLLNRLEEFGLVTSGKVGGWRTYDADSVQAVLAAAELCSLGLEPRHLRIWRQSVDREMALIEQLVLPLLRQSNPTSRDRAGNVARDVERLGEDLRSALAARALRQLIG